MIIMNRILCALTSLILLFQLSDAKSEPSEMHRRAIEDWGVSNDFAVTDDAVKSIWDTFDAYSKASHLNTDDMDTFETYLTFHLTSKDTIPTFSEIFGLQEDDSAMVLPRPNTSLLIITTDPSDANLSVNSTKFGQLRRRIKVASGTYHIRASKTGYKSCSVEGQIEAGERKTVSCLLEINDLTAERHR